MTVHVVGVLVIVGALFFFAPKQPLSFFVRPITSNLEGWPYWWAFVVGLLQAQWTFTGYDASASVSEETVDPKRRVPWAIVMAVAVSAIVGYLLLIALTLAIRDIPSVLNARDATGHQIPAVIAILTDALGERAGALATALAVVAMWFCGLSAVTWSSRTIYAFARDEGMPGSRIWKRVSSRHSTPAPAIWFCVVVAFLATISSGTYAAVTSISVMGLYFSYIIPVYLAWRRRGTASEAQRFVGEPLEQALHRGQDQPEREHQSPFGHRNDEVGKSLSQYKFACRDARNINLKNSLLLSLARHRKRGKQRRKDGEHYRDHVLVTQYGDAGDTEIGQLLGDPGAVAGAESGPLVGKQQG